MTPHENVPGVEMVSIDVCHNELRGCPNALIPTGEWKRALEEWLRVKNVAERLRAHVKSGKSLAHHKLRISISGCPNGCSRPQIADIGLVGFVRPDVAPANCTACGACEAACPDHAITVHDGPPEFDRAACLGCIRCRDACPVRCISLSKPGVRVLLGGKLGRHPRLAEIGGEYTEPSSAIDLIGQMVDNYLEQGLAEERFADFLFRTRHTPRASC